MLNITKKNKQYFTVFASVIFVLLTSCPVKSSIKSLAGVPIHTEQQSTKKNNSLVGNGMEKCADVQTTDATIFQSASSGAGDLLPLAFLAVAFIFLFGYVHTEVLAHPRYRNQKIPGALPLFIRHRKLIL